MSNDPLADLMAWGADAQRNITGGNTFQENWDAGYIPYQWTGPGSPAKEIYEPIGEGAKAAGEVLYKFSSNLQDASYNFQVGLSEAAKTAGGYANALTGKEGGIFGQIGALAPVVVIGIIGIIILTRKF